MCEFETLFKSCVGSTYMDISRERFQVVKLLLAAKITSADDWLDFVWYQQLLKFVRNALNSVRNVKIADYKNQHWYVNVHKLCNNISITAKTSATIRWRQQFVFWENYFYFVFFLKEIKFKRQTWWWVLTAQWIVDFRAMTNGPLCFLEIWFLAESHQGLLWKSR